MFATCRAGGSGTSWAEAQNTNFHDSPSHAFVYFIFSKVLEACSGYLHAQLDSANCVDILDLSETFGLNRLRHSSYRFVSESLSSIAPSQLLTLSGDQMERLLSADFPVDVAEADILDLVLTW